MKQGQPSRRLTGMHVTVRKVVGPLVRIGAMAAVAMLLIMGLFPAILAAQAGRN
jgi:hypothetical protein